MLKCKTRFDRGVAGCKIIQMWFAFIYYLFLCSAKTGDNDYNVNSSHYSTTLCESNSLSGQVWTKCPTRLDTQGCHVEAALMHPELAELAIENGLIFKSHRLVILEVERRTFLKTLHTAHMGEEKMLLLARQHIFWPGISEDVRCLVRRCDTCQKTRPSQQKESLHFTRGTLSPMGEGRCRHLWAP